VRRDPITLALLATVACALALAATGLAALLWPAAQARDSLALASLNTLDREGVGLLLNAIVHLCDPQPYGVFGLGLIAVALARRRPRIAVAVAVLLFAAAATTQVLKPLLATPRDDAWLQSNIGSAAWPSGHATAALTLALCAVLVAPRRLRAAVAVLGAGFAVAVAWGIVILAWHFPSDVLGGFLVATTWTLLAVATLLWSERRWPVARRPAPAPGRPVLWPIELAAAGAFALVVLAALARPEAVGEFARDNTTAVAMLGAIAALALALSTGVARTLRR
jgi:membrane-associated phospholipid phosphatase